MAKKGYMVRIEEQVQEETRRQIKEINLHRKRGNKLTMGEVVERMLQMWNRVGNGKT